MAFSFATCETSRALGFLKKLYPSNVEKVEWENFPKLKSLIERDILRIQDPDFHQPAQIIAGNQYKQEHDEEIGSAISEFKGVLHND